MVRKMDNSSLWEAKGAALVQAEDYKAGVCADVCKSKNHKLQQKKLQLEMRGKKVSQWQWLSTGTGCPESARLCPCRNLKLDCIRLCCVSPDF